MIIDYINPTIFFVALFIGFLIAYITTPIPEIVIKYPTPQNAGKVVYKDNADNCYKYEAKQIKCPKNKDGPKPIVTPIQHINIDDKKNESVFTTMGKWMK
jgi:hypothetical protein